MSEATEPGIRQAGPATITALRQLLAAFEHHCRATGQMPAEAELVSIAIRYDNETIDPDTLDCVITEQELVIERTQRQPESLPAA